MQAIDSGSEENRFSIVSSDCQVDISFLKVSNLIIIIFQKAYRTWTCSVKIPYFYENYRIPPCQTICDEVERICPTFRPSNHEPLFAGQSLFFCNGKYKYIFL